MHDIIILENQIQSLLCPANLQIESGNAGSLSRLGIEKKLTNLKFPYGNCSLWAFWLLRQESNNFKQI